ncbi:MAG: hypothetical protein HYX55_07560 [Chloroflexi bacterium]|nr:hypothetical protein [Chloroflexota bacterium]
MHWRTKLGALLAAGGLVMLAASAVVAAPPTYTFDVTKTADPGAVPATGGDVEYTIWVENTGTGFFQTVVVDDGMAGCTLGAPTGDDGDGKFEPGETWAYSCTVTGVTPGTQNTASVNGCHDLSACVSSHDFTDTGSVTVTEGDPATQPPATEPPATNPPATNPPSGTPNPTSAVAGATQPTTDAELGAASAGTGTNGLLLVIALGMLLASVVLVKPAKPVRQR